jgi:hypothetical protein
MSHVQALVLIHVSYFRVERYRVDTLVSGLGWGQHSNAAESHIGLYHCMSVFCLAVWFQNSESPVVQIWCVGHVHSVGRMN